MIDVSPDPNSADALVIGLDESITNELEDFENRISALEGS